MSSPQLDLSQDEVAKVIGFLGYGNPSAPVWFIGLEEGLIDEDAVFNLGERAKFGELMDLRNAHQSGGGWQR